MIKNYVYNNFFILYQKQEPEKLARGFSWVQPGSLQPLSKPDEPR